MKRSYVYILKCRDASYYVGVTNNVFNRLEEHKKGIDTRSYTFKRRPVKLVFYSEFTEIEKAIEREKQIKKWSRAKKEALIEGRFKDLPNLSKKKF